MTDTQNIEKDKIKSPESQPLSNRQIFKKIIKYIQENVGGFTFIFTSITAIGSMVIRGILYLIEYGKTMYYNISPLLIDVSDDNILYDLFVKGVFALVYLLFNLIPYYLWKGERKIRVKLGYSLLLVLSPEVIVIFCLIVDISRGIKYSIGDVVTFFICGLILGAIVFSFGLLNGVYEYISKSRKKEENQLNGSKIIIQIIALFTVEALLFIFAGWYNMYAQSHFKIINNGKDIYYAVVYENPSRYVITECKIEEGYISFPKIDIQQEIDRDGIEYQWQRLTQKR